MIRSTSHTTAPRRGATACFAAALLLGASAAGAQSYTGQFRGATTGCFDNSAPYNCTSAGITDNLEGLSFTGLAPNSFLGTVTNGSGTLTLGTLRLSDDDGNGSVLGFNAFDGSSFRLFVNITTPGSDADVFTAALDGTFDVDFGFTDDNDGSVGVNFGGPQLFTYTTANGSGSFNLAVNDTRVNINCGLFCSSSERPTATITGQITSAQFTATPEPATIALLASGLAAIGGMGVVRRRRENV